MLRIQKSDVVEKVIAVLFEKINVMKKSVEFAHVTATHEETKAESKYDTFALEASYLANGQSKRLADLEDSLFDYQNLQLKDYLKTDAIQVGSLVTLEDDEGQKKHFFLAPSSGGILVELDGCNVTTLTVDSPMGAQLVGAHYKSSIEVQIKNHTVEYEIINVI